MKTALELLAIVSFLSGCSVLVGTVMCWGLDWVAPVSHSVGEVDGDA